MDAKELLLDRSSSWAIDGEGTKSAYEEDYSFGLVVVPRSIQLFGAMATRSYSRTI